MFFVPDVAVGAVTAALIAGTVSFLGLIISKEQKTSEFRQAWIDALRSDISAVIAHINAIHGAGAANLGSPADQWKVVRPDFVGVNEAVARIKLRLNPTEPSAKAVLDAIESLEYLVAPESPMDYKEINEMEDELVRQARVLLKDEWRRVKEGELTYRVFKYFALAVMILSVSILIFGC